MPENSGTQESMDLWRATVAGKHVETLHNESLYLATLKEHFVLHTKAHELGIPRVWRSEEAAIYATNQECHSIMRHFGLILASSHEWIWVSVVVSRRFHTHHSNASILIKWSLVTNHFRVSCTISLGRARHDPNRFALGLIDIRINLESCLRW